MFAANDRIHDFRQKLQFWKTCFCHHEFDGLSTLKDLPDEFSAERRFFETALTEGADDWWGG